MRSATHKIYTIGHSTHPIEDFIELLQLYKIEMLVDVRTIPGSRHNPQFNEEALKTTLAKSHIHYLHLSQLGGLRKSSKDSINEGWHNLSFRGFADYMQTPSFIEGIEELEEIAKKYTTAIMCAESVPWRCHRSLIADALTVQKWQVLHIMNKKTAQPHKLTAFLRVHKGHLTYPDV